MTTMDHADRAQLAAAERHIQRAPKDQLAGLVSALLERDDIPESVLAFILRGVRPPVPAGRSSIGMVNSSAALAELAQGMLYREREGKRKWLRIVEIGPLLDLPRCRDAVVHPAFSHEFVKEYPIRIFEYTTPYEVKVPEGTALA